VILPSARFVAFFFKGCVLTLVLKASAVWVPGMETCMRLHTHITLINNSVLLASEVFFLLLMASGIYMRNSGLRAFKIMFREVRDRRFHAVGSCL
jgi:hypothetical protein